MSETTSNYSRVDCSSEDELVTNFSQKRDEPSNYLLGDKISDNKNEEITSTVDEDNNNLKDELEQSVHCLEKILSEDNRKNIQQEFCEVSDEPTSSLDGNTLSEIETVKSVVESDDDSKDNLNIDIGSILVDYKGCVKLNECIDEALHDQLIDEFEVIEKEVTEENNMLLKPNQNNDVSDTTDRESDRETEEEVLGTEVEYEEVNKVVKELEEKEQVERIDFGNEEGNWNQEELECSSLEANSKINATLDLDTSNPTEYLNTSLPLDLNTMSSTPTFDQTCISTPTMVLNKSDPTVDQNTSTASLYLAYTPAFEKTCTSTPIMDLNTSTPAVDKNDYISIVDQNISIPTVGLNTLEETCISTPTLDLKLSTPTREESCTCPSEPILLGSSLSHLSSSDKEFGWSDKLPSTPISTSISEVSKDVQITTQYRSPIQISTVTKDHQSTKELIIATSSKDDQSSKTNTKCTSGQIQKVPECDVGVTVLTNAKNEEDKKVCRDIDHSDLNNDIEDEETIRSHLEIDDLVEKSKSGNALDILIEDECIDTLFRTMIKDKSTPATPSSTPTNCVPDITESSSLMFLLKNIKDKVDGDEVCDSNCNTSANEDNETTSAPKKNSESDKTRAIPQIEKYIDTQLNPIENYIDNKFTPDSLKSLINNIKDKEDDEEICNSTETLKIDDVGNSPIQLVINDSIKLEKNTETPGILGDKLVPVQHGTEPKVNEDENVNLETINDETNACQDEYEEYIAVKERAFLVSNDQANELPVINLEVDENTDDKSNFDTNPLENVMLKSVQSDILKKMIAKEINILHSSTEKLDLDSSNDAEHLNLPCSFLKPNVQVEPENSDLSDFADERKAKRKPTKTKRKKGKKTKKKNKPDLSQESLAQILLPMRLECEESEILQEILTPVYSSQESLYSSQASLHAAERSPQNLNLIPPSHQSTRFASQQNLDTDEADFRANIETIESLRLPNEDPVPCEPLASLSLEGKMSMPGNAWFPWKTMSFLLLIATAAIINIDVNKHGNFKRSNTGQFMKDIGQYDRTMAAYQLVTTSAISASLWAKEYSNHGYNTARKYAGPSMDVMTAKVSEAIVTIGKYGMAGLENAREIVKAGVDKVGVMLPGLEDQAHVYWVATRDLAIRGTNAVSEGWKEVTSGNVNIDWDGLKTGAIEKAVYLQKQLEQVLQWAKDQINTLVK